MSTARPPCLAEWLVRAAARSADRLEMLGDLQEEFAARARADRRDARRWYWRQACWSVPASMHHRFRAWRRRRARTPRGDGLMNTLLHDVRYGLRGVFRNWAFSLVVILTLSVGIGANTLVYSVVDGVVLNPFPFPEPQRLVGIGSEWPRLSQELAFWETLSPPEYRDVQQQSETLEHVVMWDMGYRSVASGAERPEVLFSAFWFDDAFPTLGMSPIHGRGFSPGELERGDRVAIVSHRHWRTRMGADAAAIGRPILVEGEPYTLIGVMPPAALIYATDLWIPLGVSPERFRRNARQMQILARVKEGYTLADVNTELAAISGRIEQEFGQEFQEYAGWRMRALTWTDVNVRMVKPAALALLGAVSFVLLIVCANVASLLLARSATRRKEIAVRTAMGAARSRIVQQLLTESVILAAIGGAIGALITFVTVPVIMSAVPARLPIALDVDINHRVLLFTGAVSILAGVIFGLMPALHGVRGQVHESLKAEGVGATGTAGRLRLQRAFVGAEVAVALVLLVQGGLLANSFIRMQNVDPGFDTENILTMRLTLPRSRYDPPQVVTFFQTLVERIEGLPGVREAGAGTQFPPLTFARSQFAVDGQVYQNDEQLPTSYTTLITDGFIEALGVPLIRGRTFTGQDTPNTTPVAVINEAAARRYFSDGDPIGQRFRIGGVNSRGSWHEVIGVVASVRNRGPEVEPQPELFANVRQVIGGSNQFFLVIRTERDPRSILAAVQNEVAALDPEQPVYAVQTVEDAFGVLTAPRRLGTVALTVFALFAMGLAAAGIYSVVSYGVGERTKEIGLRIALGATGSAVRRLVVRQAMTPVIVGGVIGLILAVGMGRALSDFLFEVSGTDPITVAGVALGLAGVAIAASYFPAYRASRLNPTVALRGE